MKVIIFGTGAFYRMRREKIESKAEIVAFIDNNTEIQGTYVDGKLVSAPENIHEFVFDAVLPTCVKPYEMKKQLLDLGVDEQKIWYWERFKGEMYHGTFQPYCGNYNIGHSQKRILIISTDLDYVGGPIATVYAARALQDKSYHVTLAASDGNQEFIREVTGMGINIMICPALPYLYREELSFIQQFDVVLVNVFSMIMCAYEISKIKPVMWWIHECKESCQNTFCQFNEYMHLEMLSKVQIYAVSSVAQKNFNQYFPDRIKDTLACGIPDMKSGDASENKKDGLIFAVIGFVCEIKAQDIFIRAAKLINAEDKKNVQFWIIGFIGSDPYSNKIKELASNDVSFKIWGDCQEVKSMKDTER